LNGKGASSGKILSAGCALLVVCALASADTSKPTSAATKKPASPLHAPAHKTSGNGKKSRKSAGNWRRHGQQKIDPKRAQEIQEALVREHYLDGKPSGVWDAASQKAMEKYQADNGWQSKEVPDSRALIKMGLGPDHAHLLNPESAMTSQPVAPAVTPVSAPATSDTTSKK
jgi:hypothetical protein